MSVRQKRRKSVVCTERHLPTAVALVVAYAPRYNLLVEDIRRRSLKVYQHTTFTLARRSVDKIGKSGRVAAFLSVVRAHYNGLFITVATFVRKALEHRLALAT